MNMQLSVPLDPPATFWIIRPSSKCHVGYYNLERKFICIRSFEQLEEAMSFHSSVAPNNSQTVYHRIDMFTFECGHFDETKWNPVHITSTEEEAIEFCYQANLKPYSAA